MADQQSVARFATFGAFLKYLRRRAQLTQAELAIACGYSTPHISHLENDQRLPDQATLLALFVPALGLQDEPDLVEELLGLASTARSTEPVNGMGRQGDRVAQPLNNLPVQATSFVGRAEERAQITERLGNPTCRLLTLVGPGGIGKTRLALQAASEQSDRWTHGVWLVPLAPINTPDLLPAAIAGALQFSFYGTNAPTTQLLYYLHDKHLLLLLDNAEHLLNGIELLSDILAQAVGVKLLVTSRERLNVQEEWALTIEGMPFPEAEAWQSAESYSAVQLFTQRARQIQAGFADAENIGSVVAICQAVEGMPLALELAAGWLRMMPCHEIANQIQYSLDFLASSLRNVPDRHRSIRAVFDRSWSLLTDAERSVLAWLSIFRGGFDREAAEQVSGASLTVLTALVDKSVIRPAPSYRYDLHELLRQYAYDKLVERGEVNAAAQRHLEYFVGLAERSEAMLYTPDQTAWHDRLDANHDNLRTALGWALAGGDATMGLRLAAALEWFWNRRLYDGRDWLARLLAAASDAPATVRAKALHRAGELSTHFEDRQQSRAFNEAALALAREIGDQWSVAWSLNNLGRVKYALGEYSQARALFEEALALFRVLGDGWGITHALARLCWVAVEVNDQAALTRLLEEFLSLARAAGVKNLIASALQISAEAVFIQGSDLDRAVALYEESQQLFRDAGDRTGIVLTSRLLSQLAYLQGDDERVWKLQDECATLIQATGWLPFLEFSLCLRARTARRQGNYGYAREALAKCLAFSQAGGFLRGIEYPLALLGGLAVDQRKPARAAKMLGAVRTYFEASSMSRDPYRRAILTEFEHDIAAARAQLGEEAFAATYAEGQRMTLDQAIAYALDERQLAAQSG